MYERILVATDDSRLSRKAVKAATGLAASLGAELFVLHVVPRYPTSWMEGAMSLEADDVARVEREWAERGRSVADQAAQAAADAGVKARGVVVQSDAVADAVLAAARKHKCGLVVMASHGRRLLQRILLGSETQKVLANADRPVLVLR